MSRTPAHPHETPMTESRSSQQTTPDSAQSSLPRRSRQPTPSQHNTLLPPDSGPRCVHPAVPIPPNPAISSTTRIADIVTFPVLVTTYEYDTRSPARDTVAEVALLTTDNPGVWAIVTVPEEEPSDTVRSGAVPPAGVGP